MIHVDLENMWEYIVYVYHKVIYDTCIVCVPKFIGVHQAAKVTFFNDRVFEGFINRIQKFCHGTLIVYFATRWWCCTHSSQNVLIHRLHLTHIHVYYVYSCTMYTN